MRRFVSVAALMLLVVAGAACTPALSSPGGTSSITLVSTSTVNGWRYDYYRNSAYPCSISGYQTFTIGTKVGSSPTAAAPLWTFLHGGGTGYFDATGTPQPDATQMTENTATALRYWLTNDGLVAKVRADPAAFRTLAVSYCDRDIYGGGTQADPNNPHQTAGATPTVNGLFATKAAIQFAQSKYPTTKTFLHGASAGSAGAYYVAWALQQQGAAPAGVVGDSGVANIEAADAAYTSGTCTQGRYSADGQAIFTKRLHPDIANPANEVDKLVSSGRLTVPLLQVWSRNDSNELCGAKPMLCPLRNGSSVTMAGADCAQEPLRAAIAAAGAASHSESLRLCVDNDATPDCSLHQVTIYGGLTNTNPAAPSDYLTAIMSWVDARLAGR